MILPHEAAKPSLTSGYNSAMPDLKWPYNTLMQKFRIFLSHITVESRLADIIKKHLVRDFIALVEVFGRLTVSASQQERSGSPR